MSGTRLTITTTSLLPAASGSGYSFPLNASGGTGQLTWSLFAGTLPTGLTLSAGGVLSGTPTGGGSYPLTFSVTDSGNPAQVASAALTLLVNNGAVTTLSFVTQPSNAVAGQIINPPIQGERRGRVNVTLSIGNNPGGAAGTLSATANNAGIASFANTEHFLCRRRLHHRGLGGRRVRYVHSIHGLPGGGRHPNSGGQRVAASGER